MTGFQAPNYTQVPNDFFDLVMEMTEAETRILCALIRITFGYHRDEIKMSVRELAKVTKMSTSSVWVGAEKLEARGLIERSVSNNTTSTIWTVVISDTKLYRQIIKTVSNDSEEKRPLPLKRKKEKKDEDEVLATISKAYYSEIGMITPMIADELIEASTSYPLQWTLDAIKEAATQNKRGWKYILAILTRWKAQGNQEAVKRPNTRQPSKPLTKQDQSLLNIQSWLAKQDNPNGI